jgi:two-component system, NarL family, nitrate/nitrite response regulator NarL
MTTVGLRPISVAIVDDHALLAQVLTDAVRAMGFGAESIVPHDIASVHASVEALRPDVVLLDLDLGEIGDSIPAIAPLRELGVRVVVVTGETSRARWGRCIEAGADAVISKAVSFDELLERIARVLDDANGVMRSERDELLACAREEARTERQRHERFRRLSARECEVLDALMNGTAPDDIASMSFVSITTVRSHIRSILQKLEVNSQLAAVALAVRSAWRSPHSIDPR